MNDVNVSVCRAPREVIYSKSTQETSQNTLCLKKRPNFETV